MATESMPGDGEVPGGYPAPTPHLANVDHTPFHAPTSVPEGNPAPGGHAGFEALGTTGTDPGYGDLGPAKQL